MTEAAVAAALERWACLLPSPIREPRTLRLQVTFAPIGGVGPTSFRYRVEEESSSPTTLAIQWSGSYEATSSARVTIGSASLSDKRSAIEGVSFIDGSTNVPARIGTSFGVSYKFEGPRSGSIVRYQTIWRFPTSGLPNRNTGKPNFTQERERVCRVGAQCISGWTFDADWELVPGVWTVEIWRDDALLFTKAFDVSTP